MIEIIWRILEVGLVILGTSIYWILRRDKDAAMISAIIFGLIDKGRFNDATKITAIDRYTDALKRRWFDMTKFATKFKQRYNG
jgi:hypothetical protein